MQTVSLFRPFFCLLFLSFRPMICFVYLCAIFVLSLHLHSAAAGASIIPIPVAVLVFSELIRTSAVEIGCSIIAWVSKGVLGR